MDIININEELAEVVEAEMMNRREPKVYRVRKDPFEMYSESEFKNRYRMRKEVARFIINLVEGQIEVGRRGGGISPALQVLITIRYLCKGAYEEDIGKNTCNFCRLTSSSFYVF